MKFFIDTANVDEIQEASEYGLLDGVTTNPTLLSKEPGDPEQILREITKIVNGPVSAEVTALDSIGMIEEGLLLRKIAENIVVKVPMTLEGLKAIQEFSSDPTFFQSSDCLGGSCSNMPLSFCMGTLLDKR